MFNSSSATTTNRTASEAAAATFAAAWAVAKVSDEAHQGARDAALAVAHANNVDQARAALRSGYHPWASGETFSTLNALRILVRAGSCGAGDAAALLTAMSRGAVSLQRAHCALAGAGAATTRFGVPADHR